MSDDAKADEMVDQLREAFARNLCTALTGLPAHQALQLADSLCAVQLDVLAGMRVSYKAKPAIDSEAITEDWRRGLTVAEITRKHGISKPTAYKHHPNRGQKHVRAG